MHFTYTARRLFGLYSLAASLVLLGSQDAQAQPANAQDWRAYAHAEADSGPATDISSCGLQYPFFITGANRYMPATQAGLPIGTITQFDSSRIHLAALQISARGVRIDSTNRAFYFITQSGELYRQQLGVMDPVRIPAPPARDVGTNCRGDLWIIGSESNDRGDGPIYQYVMTTGQPANDWLRVDGAAHRIDVAPNGTAWVVNRAGEIYARVNNGWKNQPGRGQEITVGENGAVMVVGSDSALYQFAGKNIGENKWRARPGRFTAATVLSTGRVWAIGADGKAYEFTGSQF